MKYDMNKLPKNGQIVLIEKHNGKVSVAQYYEGNKKAKTHIADQDIKSWSPINRYCIVHKDNLKEIIRSFKKRAEANYFITDCYGPESTNYVIIDNPLLKGILK